MSHCRAKARSVRPSACRRPRMIAPTASARSLPGISSGGLAIRVSRRPYVRRMRGFFEGSAMRTPASSSRVSSPAPATRASASVERRRIGQHDLEGVEPECPGGRGRRARALPGVAADVMVVAAGAEEERPGVGAGRDVEAERARVERLGRGDVRDVQVHMAEHGPGGHLRHRRLGQVGHHTGHVERQRRHAHGAGVPVPLLGRAVTVDLDAVALGVAQVDRLADEMVGGAGERPARLGHAADRGRKLGAVRHEQRQMEEPGRGVRPRVRRRPVQQLDERRSVARAERDAVVVALEHAQADRELIEARHPVEVAHAQAHPAESRLRIDARGGLHAGDAIARHPLRR